MTQGTPHRMNLYKVLFMHYSPKDSREGVWGFVLAEDDAQVFDKLVSLHGPCHWGDEPIETWDEVKKEIVEVSRRDKIIQECGDYWVEDLGERHYGVTQWKWELIIDVDHCGSADDLYKEVEAFKEYGFTVL